MVLGPSGRCAAGYFPILLLRVFMIFSLKIMAKIATTAAMAKMTIDSQIWPFTRPDAA